MGRPLRSARPRPTTAARSSGSYRRLTSLREYVLVSQHEPLVEVFAREGDAGRVSDYGPGDTIQLPSVGASIAIDTLYADPLTS